MIRYEYKLTAINKATGASMGRQGTMRQMVDFATDLMWFMDRAVPASLPVPDRWPYRYESPTCTITIEMIRIH